MSEPRQQSEHSPAVERLEPRQFLSATAAGGVQELQTVRRTDSVIAQLAAAGTGRKVTTDTSQLVARDAAGRLGVRITAKNTAKLLPLLKAIGFRVAGVAAKHRFIEGFLPKGALYQAEALASKGLFGISAMYRPMTASGSVNSQGDFVLESDRVRATLPAAINGAGVNVGILSDSYNRLGGASAGVSSGNLPSGVNVVLEGPISGVIDEGRAMAEIVHDIAPGAGIAFGSAFFGQAQFAQTIRDLANPAIGNAKVITDDVFYFEEPMFQDGVIAQAIDDVTSQGASYFALAGNLGSNAYESTWRSGTDATYGTSLDFDPGAGVDTRQRLTLSSGQRVILNLQWDDPFFTTNGVDGDLHLYLLSTTGAVLASSVRDNISTKEPSELLSYTHSAGGNLAVDVVVQLASGSAPGRVKWVNYGANNSGPVTINEYATNSPTVIPHSAAAGGMSVGTVNYYSQSTTASYSSLGPATIYFNSDGTPKASPEVRQAPDITAVDGVDTTFFGSDSDGNGFPNFFGTSAAAPHAAAVAALVKQANPSFTPTQVYNRMTSTAQDINAVGIDDTSGVGLIDAYGAVFGPVVPAALPAVDGFESGALGQAWETVSTGAGRKVVTTGNSPATGTRHLGFGSGRSGFSGRNEATLRVDASSPAGDVILTFDQKEFSDSDNTMPPSFTTSSNADGVALSANGTDFFRIVSLTGATSTNSYQSFRFNLSSIAAANAIALGGNTRIRFQQFGSAALGSGGMVFDNIRVAAAGVTVTPTSGLTTTELGGTAQFTVVLNAAPASNVTIPVSSSDSTEGLPDTALLTFTPANWNTPQTVTVTGVPDGIADGNQPYSIVLGAATSTDSAYSGMNPADVTLTNIDVVPPTITSWASVGVHGLGVGEAGLTIPDTGLFSEGRVSGVRMLLVTFDSAINPASLTPAGVIVSGLDVNNQPVNLAGYTATIAMRNGDTAAMITFNQALPNYARYRIRVTGVTGTTGGALAGDNDRILTALLGDATGDLRTNNTDVGGVISLRGIQPINPLAEFEVRSDLTIDGRVNNTDVGGAISERGKDARFISDPS